MPPLQASFLLLDKGHSALFPPAYPPATSLTICTSSLARAFLTNKIRITGTLAKSSLSILSYPFLPFSLILLRDRTATVVPEPSFQPPHFHDQGHGPTAPCLLCRLLSATPRYDREPIYIRRNHYAVRVLYNPLSRG